MVFRALAVASLGWTASLSACLDVGNGSPNAPDVQGAGDPPSTEPGGGGGGGDGGPNTPGDPDGDDDEVNNTPCSEENPGPRMLRLLTRAEYGSTVSTLLAIADPAVESLPDAARVEGYDNNAVASVVSNRVFEAFTAKAEELADRAVREARSNLLTCTTLDDACVRPFLESFLGRAFRRPAEAAELARYQALFAPDLSGGSLDEGVRLTVRAALTSPNFLYRPEIGTQDGDVFHLTSYEVASALSYAFTGDMPDAELSAAAADGALGTPAEREAQIHRLLATPKGRKQIASFFGQWLGIAYKLPDATKDTTAFPSFNPAIRAAMFAEHDSFVEHVVLESTHTFGELFTASYTFLDDSLSTFYGVAPAGTGATMSRREVANRGGILTLGALMTAYAHPDESSPIARGVFFRNRVLCQTLPPPPPLTSFPEEPGPNLTTRERFAAHTANAACNACHQYIDGVGFGFERFDAVGVYRDTENGRAIDDSGQVVGMENIAETSNIIPFGGAQALGGLVAGSARAQDCFAMNYYRFARGFKEPPADACGVANLASSFRTAGFDIQRLFVDTFLQKSFADRRGGGL